MRIEYVDTGIANRFEDRIELNENLKKYPQLHDAILKHEMSHTDKPGFTKEDFLLDISDSTIDNKMLLNFMVHHPKSLFQFLPVYKKKDEIVYDINLCIIWAISIIVVSGAVYLGMHI